jgi:hypothetical protein
VYVNAVHEASVVLEALWRVSAPVVSPEPVSRAELDAGAPAVGLDPAAAAPIGRHPALSGMSEGYAASAQRHEHSVRHDAALLGSPIHPR